MGKRFVTALSCSNIIPRENSSLKRKSYTVLMGCYAGRQTWHLACLSDKWVGVWENCSHGENKMKFMVRIGLVCEWLCCQFLKMS